ncbi:unnamed protein product [Echinostoma caproni]|uniref:Yippee domain-containing protein n=1 Tax=Echinostoma caproni TaxID=27848 RepID=A0A183AL75_9TREM|nr:unnamed protein product [Echinostoma caproni]
MQLICGYHHQIHHPGHRAQCSYGIVHEVRELVLHRHPFCSRCNSHFRTQNAFIDHWYKPNTSCPSPFLLTRFNEDTHDVNEVPPDHIIEIRCGTCGVHIDRVTPVFTNGHYALPKTLRRKRKRIGNGHIITYPTVFEQFRDFLHSWSRLCVNHAYLHMDGNRSGCSSECTLMIRFVIIDKSKVITVPSFVNESDDLLLQFCLEECQRLFNYLKLFRTGRKALLRQTKLTLKELCEMTKMDSSFCKINPSCCKKSPTTDPIPSTSKQNQPTPFFMS